MNKNQSPMSFQLNLLHVSPCCIIGRFYHIPLITFFNQRRSGLMPLICLLPHPDLPDIALACEDGRLIKANQAILTQDGPNRGQILPGPPGRAPFYVLRGGHLHHNLHHHQWLHQHQPQHEQWLPRPHLTPTPTSPSWSINDRAWAPAACYQASGICLLLWSSLLWQSPTSVNKAHKQLEPALLLHLRLPPLHMLLWQLHLLPLPLHLLLPC